MGTKYGLFSKGDVIRTNPSDGFYGIAVVLDDPVKLELSPGRWSHPMCHIAITPLVFQHEISLDDIVIADLKPTSFLTHKLIDGKSVPYRLDLCIGIYTNRNKVHLPIIGKIDPSHIYTEPLLWTPQGDRFFLYGDVSASLGAEAYVNWKKENSSNENLNTIIQTMEIQP